MSKQAELNHLNQQVRELKKKNGRLSTDMDHRRLHIELLEEKLARKDEEIIILKNQIHSSGKKLKIPKKPELDWSSKIDFIQRYALGYLWEASIQELEDVFHNHCLHCWKGAQKAYDKKSKGKKQGVMPINIIAFPNAGGAE